MAATSSSFDSLGIDYKPSILPQVIVQRAIGAKSNIHAKSGSIFAGFLKILPIFIMVMPGMISRVLFKDTIACADPESCLAACGNKWGCYNNAYPKYVSSQFSFHVHIQ